MVGLMTVNSGKTVDLIEMQFGVVGCVGPRNYISFGVIVPRGKGQTLSKWCCRVRLRGRIQHWGDVACSQVRYTLSNLVHL